MYAKIIVIGRLGKDPELRFTQTQKAVCNFSVAVTDRGADGKEVTEWYNIVVWEKQAENCKTFLHKGSLVYVEGRPTTRKYTDKNGVERQSSEVMAHTVKFLTPKPAAEAQPHPQAEQALAAQAQSAVFSPPAAMHMPWEDPATSILDGIPF